ncbi:molybdenum cofactor synthesis domain-containing protein [Haladaptatus litoreus]|uniref:Molybdenum cofactor synthesis domain-containing protein n=1 Tax=Haladaptatus litoreus TaxID=553468 RepID=A0A1N6WU41_9EURY|nr:molybdopterin-binding protein [Haladaptatus litoreus]SIQ93548.1 molybdenum cofactor synthesis domain-containing protein [Haladaptatus litoreus]
MQVAILTVGDELLAGDTVNTNAAWLAEEIHDRGGSVRRIMTVPDEAEVIAHRVREWRETFDAVVVTGGLGGTPDDVTMDAVSMALDRNAVVDSKTRERLEEKARQFAADNPELTDKYDLELDLNEAAELPAGGQPLVTDAGWAPGCAVENVYVFPGIPREMKAMFELVADEFDGAVVSETIHTPAPEGALGSVLSAVRERFDVAVGSYPGRGDTPGRLKVTSTDAEEVSAAVAWLRNNVEVVVEEIEPTESGRENDGVDVANPDGQ